MSQRYALCGLLCEEDIAGHKQYLIDLQCTMLVDMKQDHFKNKFMLIKCNVLLFLLLFVTNTLETCVMFLKNKCICVIKYNTLPFRL